MSSSASSEMLAPTSMGQSKIGSQRGPGESRAAAAAAATGKRARNFRRRTPTGQLLAARVEQQSIKVADDAGAISTSTASCSSNVPREGYELATTNTNIIRDELSIISLPIVIAGSRHPARPPSLMSSGNDNDNGDQDSLASAASTTSTTSTTSSRNSESSAPSSSSSAAYTTIVPINGGSSSPAAGGGHQATSNPTASGSNPNGNSAAPAVNAGQWIMAAAQTTQGMRHRMSLASDQLGHSLRQLYASASSITDVPPSYHNIPGIVPYYHGRASGPPPSYDDVINPYAPPPTYQSLFGQMREARKTSRGLIDLLRRLLIILISTLGCTILIAFMILIPFTMIIVGAIYIDECRVEHIPAFLLVGGLVWASKNIIHCYAQCQPDRPSDPHDHSDGAGFATNSSSAVGVDAEAGVDASSGRNGSNSSGGAGDNSPAELSLDSGLEGGDVLAGVSVDIASLGHHTATSVTDNHHHEQVGQHQAYRQQYGSNSRSCRRLKSSICESLLNCVLFGWFIAGCIIVFRNYEPDFENPASIRYCHRTVYMYTFWLITSAILIFGLFIGCICCLMVSSAIASRQDDDLA